MATIKIKIPNVAWRDGRPRFTPGPKLRALGFKGEDLKKPTGEWMTANEASKWAEAKQIEIAARRSSQSSGKKITPPTTKRAVYSVGHLLADWQKSDVFQEKKAKTRYGYANDIKALERWDPDLLAAPTAAITHEIAYGIYRKLRRDKGDSHARTICAALSSAWSWADRHRSKTGVVGPVFRQLGMRQSKAAPRVGTLAEMRALIAAADAYGRPEIGDSIMLGLCTGQRQGDRLRLEEAGRIDGRVYFRQSKTGAQVSIAEMPELSSRLTAATQRRRGWKVTYPNVILNERSREPFSTATGNTYYSNIFRKVRELASNGDPELGIPATPSLATFKDKDLRATAVTWLANAGCTVPEICSITGHSIKSANEILKHYLGTTEAQADAAMIKLRGWLKDQGGLR